METTGGEGEVWQREDCKEEKQEGLVALKQVLGQEFGQAERAETAADLLGSEVASEHILDLEGQI